MKITSINTTTTLNNGVEMPMLGLGVYKAKDGEEVINSIHFALEAGYRHFDTASFYENEEGVGEAIRSSRVPREEVFITTKVWNEDHGYENALEAFEISNKKLGLDYIDLYLIHWPVPGRYLETWSALEQLLKEGKVKAIGLSNGMEHHLREIMNHGQIKPMVVQNEFHPMLVQQPLLDFCKENQIQYESWSPLMRGKIFENEALKSLAIKYNRTLAQIVIRWDLQKGVVTIPKSVHKERIFENSRVFDFEISEEDMKLIDSLDNNERTGAHPDTFMQHFANMK